MTSELPIGWYLKAEEHAVSGSQVQLNPKQNFAYLKERAEKVPNSVGPGEKKFKSKPCILQRGNSKVTFNKSRKQEHVSQISDSFRLAFPDTGIRLLLVSVA